MQNSRDETWAVRPSITRACTVLWQLPQRLVTCSTWHGHVWNPVRCYLWVQAERAKPSMQQPVKEGLPVAPTLLKFLPPPGFEHFAQKTLTANARNGESHRCSRNGAEQPDRGGQTSPSDTGLISSAACPEAAGTDIADYIVKIIRTEAGAEGMVQCLASASSLGLAVAVAAVLPELPDLACDAHASKVLIALLEHCRDVSQYRVRLVQRLRGHLLKLTKDKTGCVVLQRMLDIAAVELQSCLPLELRGKVLACSQHLHGNFVLQRCVEGHAASIATHIYACRILQRLVERCPSHPEMPELLQSILQPMDQLERLCKDPYGNNVIRSLLLRGSGTAARFVINAISTDVLKFSRNRHSSLVVERCIMVSSDERQEEFGCERAALMGALLLDGSGGSNPAFLQLMLDRFGNYIAQRVIECCQGTEALRVEQLLHRSWAKLQNSSNGRHIIAAARKRFGGGEMSFTNLKLLDHRSFSIGFKSLAAKNALRQTPGLTRYRIPVMCWEIGDSLALAHCHSCGCHAHGGSGHLCLSGILAKHYAGLLQSRFKV
eukprot:s3835_g9.t2